MPRVEDNMSENTEVIISLHYKNLFFDTYSGLRPGNSTGSGNFGARLQLNELSNTLSQ